ncbi:unnamed protein product [Brassicogethes aeneus]|uniref:Uncharacterized protein n=1 Tax=Brassicogethes aeneus TaxID=1431903 RepID=A0A9P0B4N7_BRAAE|nr:unnamed protein product [Brassicogethes aeneus]
MVITIWKKNQVGYGETKTVACDFDLNDERYPTSICVTCKLALLERQKDGVFRRPLLPMPEFHKLDLRKTLRSGKPCTCLICSEARKKGHKKVFSGRGNSRVLSKDVVLKKKKCICATCLQEIGKGKKHYCHLSNIAHNVSDLVQAVPKNQKQQIVSKIIHEYVETNNQSSIGLATLGRPSRIAINPPPHAQKEIKFSYEKLSQFQKTTCLSNNKMELVTNFVRTCAGKKSVSSNFREKLREESKTLEPFYKCAELEFDVSDCKEKQKRKVIYADAESILEAVITHRQLIGSPKIKVMADGGQGFFKICLSVFQSEDETKVGRSVYSEGGKISKGFKFTGVKKILILCIVPEIQETFENLKLLFSVIKINNISFKFVSDLKVTLIVNGLQTASSTFPCPYCYVKLKHSVGNEASTLRTYGDIKLHYEKFCLFEKNRKYAKDCFSVVNHSIFDEEGDVSVLEKCFYTVATLRESPDYVYPAEPAPVRMPTTENLGRNRQEPE